MKYLYDDDYALTRYPIGRASTNSVWIDSGIRDEWIMEWQLEDEDEAKDKDECDEIVKSTSQPKGLSDE